MKIFPPPKPPSRTDRMNGRSLGMITKKSVPIPIKTAPVKQGEVVPTRVILPDNLVVIPPKPTKAEQDLKKCVIPKDLSKINLPKVTIFGIWWSDLPNYPNERFNRTIRVLNYCQSMFNPYETILFCYPEPPIPVKARIVRIPKLDMDEYNYFINKEIPTHIHSEYAMSVHEDGFPYRLDLWDNRFLDYDYIGSPWPDGVVGNGGFSIESKKLMDAAAPLAFRGPNSDILVCRQLRKHLEIMGIKFAPKEVALKFSTELLGKTEESYGFHGRYNGKFEQAWEFLEQWEKTNWVKAKKVDIVKTETKQDPQLEIVYIHVANNQSYLSMAKNFVQSYIKNPPGKPHKTTIICNGGEPTDEIRKLYQPIPDCTFLPHDNSGYDIGGFQKASRLSTADLLVFFGASTYFNGAGWATRIIESYLKHGDALYGTMGNQGDPGVSVNRHIRSTAFWMTPQLFNQYPMTVTQLDQRYEFEHRGNCLTEWIMQGGLKALVVGWKGEYEFGEWDTIPNGFHRGNQSNLMIGDHISQPPHYPRKLQNT